MAKIRDSQLLTKDIFTHLASSTSHEDFDYCKEQYMHYSKALNQIQDEVSIGDIETHFTDSAALLRLNMHFPVSSIRTGMSILGLDPVSDVENRKFSISFPYKFESVVLDKHCVEKGEYYGYEKKAKDNLFTCAIGVGYCDGMQKAWIGESVIRSEYGYFKLLDVSMNSSIVEIPEHLFDKFNIFQSKLVIISSQNELNQLAKLAKTSIEDILSGFLSGNSYIDYQR